AIRAWMATVRTVAGSIAGGISPTTSSGARLVPVSIHCTRFSVGVTTGKPSDHSFSRKNSKSSTTVAVPRPPLHRKIERAEICDLLGLGELREQALGLRLVTMRRQLEEFLEQLGTRQRGLRRALEIVALRRDLLAVLQLQRDAAILRHGARRALEML